MDEVREEGPEARWIDEEEEAAGAWRDMMRIEGAAAAVAEVAPAPSSLLGVGLLVLDVDTKGEEVSDEGPPEVVAVVLVVGDVKTAGRGGRSASSLAAI